MEDEPTEEDFEAELRDSDPEDTYESWEEFMAVSHAKGVIGGR